MAFLQKVTSRFRSALIQTNEPGAKLPTTEPQVLNLYDLIRLSSDSYLFTMSWESYSNSPKLLKEVKSLEQYHSLLRQARQSNKCYSLFDAPIGPVFVVQPEKNFLIKIDTPEKRGHLEYIMTARYITKAMGLERNLKDTVRNLLDVLTIQLTKLKLEGDEQESVMQTLYKATQRVVNQGRGFETSENLFRLRPILAVLAGDSLIHLTLRNVNFDESETVSICASTFDRDRATEEYNLKVLSDFINLIQEGYTVTCKNDLFTRACQRLNPQSYFKRTEITNPGFRCNVYNNETASIKFPLALPSRFELPYLTTQRFLPQTEQAILEGVEAWMEKITSRYFEDTPALTTRNFFANSSREALASLCIKTSQKLRIKGIINTEELIRDSVNLCKQELLNNATTDFLLWVELSNLKRQQKEEYDLIRGVFEAKNRVDFPELPSVLGSRIILFTHEQSSKVLAFGPSSNAKTIKFADMKSKKDLKTKIQSFLASHQDVCLIRMDYSTDIKHLPFLLSTIGNNQKSFIIVFHYSRNTDQTTLKALSYLNGWSQVFIEDFSDSNNLKISSLPSTIHTLKDEGVVDLRDSIIKALPGSIKRFSLKPPKDTENTRFLSTFTTFLSKLGNQKLFVDLVQEYISKLLVQKNVFPDWRKELLKNKEVTAKAVNTYEAIRLYFIEKVEDLLTLTLKRLFTDEAFTGIFPTFALELFETLAPGVTNYMEHKLVYLESSFEFHQKLFQNSMPNTVEQLPKEANSIEIVLSTPRLFPFSKKDEICIFIQETDKLSVTLSSLSLQLAEVEKNYVHNRGHEELEAQYKSLMKVFNQTFIEKTRLTKFDMEGKCVMNIVEKLNDKQYNIEKEFYLMDIRNLFIEKVGKVNVRASMFLDKLVMQFLNEQYTVEEYLMVLVRGEALWRHMLQIYQKIEAVKNDQDFIEKMIVPKFDKKTSMEIGNFLNTQIAFVKALVESCDKALSPIKTDFRVAGLQKYIDAFTNTYSCLLNLRTELGKENVTIPLTMTVWKNVIDLIESIDQDKAVVMFEKVTTKLDGGMDITEVPFEVIDEFLEELKQTQAKHNKLKISNFQAAVVFKFWFETSQKDADKKEAMEKKLLERISTDDYFASFCNGILGYIMKGKDFSDASRLAEQFKELDGIFVVFEKNVKDSDYSGTLTTILTDYIEKLITIPKVADIKENHSKTSAQLSANFETFHHYLHKLESQEYNSLQVLAVMGYLRHFTKDYVDCLIECATEKKNYEIVEQIDHILAKQTPFTDALCIFALKLLRMKEHSFSKFKKFLFETCKAKWVARFEEHFEQTSENIFFIPTLLEGRKNQEVEDKWVELSKTSFNDDKLLEDLITIAKTNHITQYQFLNILLTNLYTGLTPEAEATNLRALVEKNEAILKEAFSKYQLDLIHCYLKQSVDKGFLNVSAKLSPEELNVHILALNVVNWLVCLKNFNSPLTSMFFEQGEIPADFSTHFNKRFIITGQDNPYIENAMAVRHGCRFSGVYLCSAECDYLYTIEDCGWPSEPEECPFCHEDAGNARGKPAHTLGRTEKGARRLGPELTDWHDPHYCWNTEFQQNEEYWTSLEKAIDEDIERMKERAVIKIFEGQLVEKNMTGYNRYTSSARDNTVTRIRPITDCFLRFMLHSSLYVISSLQWVKPEEILEVVKVDAFDGMLTYLKDNIKDAAEALQKNLDCNDSLVWILAVQQMVSEIVEKSTLPDSEVKYKHREVFEKEVEDLINSKLGDQQVETIRAYKKTSQVSSQKLELILFEEKVVPEYKFLQALRINKAPCLEDMKASQEHVIKTKYPLLEECLKNISDIEDISKLAHIIKFTNEIINVADHQISREDAKTMKVADLVRDLPKEKKEAVNALFEDFLRSWNNLNLGPIQYQCKVLGSTAKYDKDTPLCALLIDSMDDNNENGKILAGVIYTLCDRQNRTLNQLASKAKAINSLKNVQFFDNHLHLPQTAHPEDILDITEESIEQIIAETCSSNFKYGNGVPMYDFERIQARLVEKMVGKKMFMLDLSLYANVRFAGEAFSKQSRFSDYISHARRLGLTSPIPSLPLLEAKYREIQDKMSINSDAVMKQLLGSLEKLIIYSKHLNETNVSLSEYVRNHKLASMSPLITEEAPIKDYDISCIVALYEWAEQKMMPSVWRVLPDIYKSHKLDTEEREAVKLCLAKLKSPSTEGELPDLNEFNLALNRFISRCLVIESFEPEEYLTDWIYAREDFWGYPYAESAIENLSMEFPRISFDKMLALYELVDETVTPPKDSKVLVHKMEEQTVTLIEK